MKSIRRLSVEKQTASEMPVKGGKGMMKNDDIAENVLQCGKEGVRQNMAEALSEFCEEYADEMWKMGEEVIKLRAENAALRERLEKAVELPCKIGDEVYEVHGKCDGKNCPYNGDYGQWRCTYGRKRNCNSFITVNKFCYSDIPRVGKTIFVTKEAAEARLAELKGGAK